MTGMASTTTINGVGRIERRSAFSRKSSAIPIRATTKSTRWTRATSRKARPFRRAIPMAPHT